MHGCWFLTLEFPRDGTKFCRISMGESFFSLLWNFSRVKSQIQLELASQLKFSGFFFSENYSQLAILNLSTPLPLGPVNGFFSGIAHYYQQLVPQFRFFQQFINYSRQLANLIYCYYSFPQARQLAALARQLPS